MRNPISVRLLAALGALVVFAAAGHTAEPRITSTAPTATGWQVTIDGIPSPEFQQDGQTVTARRIEAGAGDGSIWEVPATDPAAAARLVVLDGGRAALAVRLGTDLPADAPFSDWTIYESLLVGPSHIATRLTVIETLRLGFSTPAASGIPICRGQVDAPVHVPPGRFVLVIGTPRRSASQTPVGGCEA